MPGIKPGEFGDHVEPGWLGNPETPRLTDVEYSRVLDSIVIACVDIVLMHGDTILMGRRAWNPMPDWWILGGRMYPGEEAGYSAWRIAQREAAITINPARFRYVCTYNAVYAVRRQKPAHHGSHTVAIVMSVELSDDEAAAVRLNEEYRGDHRWSLPGALWRSEHSALRQVGTALYGPMPSRNGGTRC